MKYTVRRKLETYEIRDEEHHLAGRVRGSLCSGCRLSAEDAESGICYEVTREKGALVIQEAEGNPAYCKIRYLEDAAGYARPPMALETELEAGDRTLMLRQKKNRTFAILENGRQLGEIRRMMSRNKELVLEEEDLKPYSGLLFAAAYLMLHDDDVMVV